MSTDAAGDGGRAALSRGRLLRVAAVLLLVAAAVWSLVPFRQGLTAARDRGELGYAAPANGDHMYYASMMLQYAGTPYLQSLDETAAYFGYPGAWRTNAYFLNPRLAPLVYPRSVLPLLGAPLVPALGVAAVFVPGILCGLATVALLVLLARRWGAQWALAPPLLLYLVGPAFAWYGTGLYTESVLCLVVVATALCLPLGPQRGLPAPQERPGLSGTLWLGALAVVAGLTRQAGLLVPAMVLAGMLGAVVLGRGGRRAQLRLWAWPAVVSLLSGLAVTAVVTVWAPYDVLSWTRGRSGGDGALATLVRAVLALPGDLATSWQTAPAGSWTLAVLLVVGLPCALWLMREPLGWVILGAAALPVATAALNGTDTLRYISPVYPLLVLAIGVVLHRAVAARRGSAAQPEPRAGAPRWVAVVSSVLAVVTTVVLVGATVAVYRGAPLHPVGTVSASDLGRTWPLAAPSAVMVCGGDDGQAWVLVDGRLYAVSGTALARRSLQQPSAEAIRAPSRLAWVNQVQPLLNRILARCTPPLRSRL